MVSYFFTVLLRLGGVYRCLCWDLHYIHKKKKKHTKETAKRGGLEEENS